MFYIFPFITKVFLGMAVAYFMTNTIANFWAYMTDRDVNESRLIQDGLTNIYLVALHANIRHACLALIAWGVMFS